MIQWNKVSSNEAVITFLQLREQLEKKIQNLDKSALINYELEKLNETFEINDDTVEAYSSMFGGGDNTFREDDVRLAELFHNTYEELAPSFGYETRQDTKVFDKNSSNGKLMIATIKRLKEAIIQMKKD